MEHWTYNSQGSAAVLETGTREALVVDDHPIVRHGIAELLQKAYPTFNVRESVGGASLVNEICWHPWAFVILDLNMPGFDGLDVLKRVNATTRNVPIIVFSLYSEEQYATRALRAGAKAYLSKDRPPEDLIDTVKIILAGGRPPMPFSMMSNPLLSDREIQVLSLITKGLSGKEIAKFLHIHEKTVSTYRARLLQKLHLRTIVDLIRYGAKEGFVE